MGMRDMMPGGDGAAGQEPGAGPTRRKLLMAGLAAGATAGAVAGTGAWRDAPRPASSPELAATLTAATGLRKPGSLPYPKLPAGTDTIPLIRHIVVLMMENHSYDNKLGMLGRAGADGFTLGKGGKPVETNPYPGGKKIQHAFRMPTTCQPSGQPSQEWQQSHIQYAGGKNNGFVKSASGPVAMGYWQQQDQPFYYSLASQFPIADRYFCSLLGQTFPNRRYLMAATSLGMIDDTFPLGYPANGTLFDALDKNHISWRNYYATTPSTLLFPQLYFDNFGSKVVPIGQFFTDAKEGRLPGFSIIDPDYGTHSEEDPQNIAVGEAFAAEVVRAVMHGREWETTLLIWTYDEHGGYYDHVPPPKAIPPDDIPPAVSKGEPAYDGFARYGFRVPCAFVSPWARKNHVSHTVYDHTSICKLVETKWNLPAMTYRDANAANMLDMLDLSSPAFAKPPKLADPLYTTSPDAVICSVTGPGTIPPPGSVT
ncbi:MAG TPA: alkaline phosphatase family protein [Streptosporangiaceae bacterium]|jgi:phospholipase C